MKRSKQAWMYSSLAAAGTLALVTAVSCTELAPDESVEDRLALSPLSVASALWAREGQLTYDVFDGPLPGAALQPLVFGEQQWPTIVLTPQPADTITIDFAAAGVLTGPTTISWGGGESAEIDFGADGTIVQLDGPGQSEYPIPVTADLFSAAAAEPGHSHVEGFERSRRVPLDEELSDDALTVQSEIRSTLVGIEDGVAQYDFEAYVRVIANPALEQFKDDADELGDIPGSAYVIRSMVDDATEPRLSAVGHVEFDLDEGHLISVEYTGLILPLESFTPAELTSHPDAFTYSIALQS